MEILLLLKKIVQTHKFPLVFRYIQLISVKMKISNISKIDKVFFFLKRPKMCISRRPAINKKTYLPGDTLFEKKREKM